MFKSFRVTKEKVLGLNHLSSATNGFTHSTIRPIGQLKPIFSFEVFVLPKLCSQMHDFPRYLRTFHCFFGFLTWKPQFRGHFYFSLSLFYISGKKPSHRSPNYILCMWNVYAIIWKIVIWVRFLSNQNLFELVTFPIMEW